MAGIGGIPPGFDPGGLQRADKDGSGGGGRYTSGRRQKDKDGSGSEDQTSFSEEAKKALARAKLLQPATGDSANRNNQLHILAEINQFNDHHTKTGSRLKAVLKPLASGSSLVIEDPVNGVTITPFGVADIFSFAPQAVRAKLMTFGTSSGALFDGRV